jgi:transposase
VSHRCRPAAAVPTRGGDRAAINALHTVVLTRLRFDSRTRDYVARRTGQGLSKKGIMR